MEDSLRPEDMRVSDADRVAGQERLRLSHDVGQLDLTEFDERVRSVWAAPPAQPDRPGVFDATPGGTAMRVLTTVWLGVLTVNLVIWGILTLTVDAAIYPWWLWVGGPTGAVLAVLYAAGIGRPKR